ncbi:MAG: EFR1 family ferrodoxin [Spirochaetes bacterium]|jgi:ferredoxin|nr:EFR1 family ferrodoxin [Spirochaetota bacterium]
MNTIYYFTGTGNTLCIANRIAAADKKTKIARITKKSFSKPALLKGKVGIIFPVYAWGAPGMVEKFLEAADYSKVEFLYIFGTFAGSDRNAMHSCATIIKKSGGRVNAAFSIKMGNNYIIASNTASPALAERMMEKREDQLTAMIESVVEKRDVPVKKSYFPLTLLASGLVHSLFLKYSGKNVSQQFTATDKCNGCKICVKVCPSENVELADKKPVWGTDCEVCLACINLCPQEAILYKKSHPERIRYRNPEIKTSDLII